MCTDSNDSTSMLCLSPRFKKCGWLKHLFLVKTSTKLVALLQTSPSLMYMSEQGTIPWRKFAAAALQRP